MPRQTPPIVAYRVEHADSLLGPYQHESRHGQDDLDRMMRHIRGPGKGTNQPTASIDIPDIMGWIGRMNVRDGHNPFYSEVLGLYEFSKVRFAFAHMAPLRAWFGDSFLPLSQEGYVVGRYRVSAPGYIHGHNQMAFHTGHAERLGTVAFTDAMVTVPLLPRFQEHKRKRLKRAA